MATTYDANYVADAPATADLPKKMVDAMVDDLIAATADTNGGRPDESMTEAPPAPQAAEVPSYTFNTLLGETLLKADGTESPTADALSAGTKAVGLYFSAHWCPPCQRFTPELAKAYTEHLKAKGLEIVFVSSDRDEASFNEYFKGMPFTALPYSARDVKKALSKKFKVQGIPTLVILDSETGEVITKDGREAVDDDPSGKSFPWMPPTIWDALGSEFLTGSEGDTVSIEQVKETSKVIGLYFSAHWCPPCQRFTPELAKAYSEHLKGKGLEIVFVSSDNSMAEFTEYFQEMPWLAIPNGDRRKDQLSKMFGVRGIPSLALIDAATGETITTGARGNVSNDPTGTEFPWYPKAFVDMATDDVDGINDELTLCLMLEGCEEETKAAATEVLESFAKAAKERGDETLFMVASKSASVCDRVRTLTKLGKPSTSPAMLLLDIPDEGGYYVSAETTVTLDTVANFLDAHKKGDLERKQLGS
jgi:nucleoredoxin